MGHAAKPLELRDQTYNSFNRRLLSRAIDAGQFVIQREAVEIAGGSPTRSSQVQGLAPRPAPGRPRWR